MLAGSNDTDCCHRRNTSLIKEQRSVSGTGPTMAPDLHGCLRWVTSIYVQLHFVHCGISFGHELLSFVFLQADFVLKFVTLRTMLLTISV